MTSKIIYSAALALMASGSLASASLITFDDLPDITGLPFTGNLPAGYAGFTWNNFLYEDALALSPNSGYAHGTVSGPNIGFNNGGTPATISSAIAFDLVSAYLVSGVSDGMKLEVQGFNGASKIYDTTYTLNTGAASLINFNYDGITSVKFLTTAAKGALSPSPMGIDNIQTSAATAPDAGQTGLMLTASLLSLGWLKRKLN